ncbi:hypothetical protein EOL70_01855 [Leucothrix sargassi]|nr:hypothetical protein EOL70_01855 [Leucothrix sargassi]
MIGKSPQNTALRVCLEDVGDHNKAVLDFFFAKLGKDTFQRVDSQEEANVLFIDYDFPPARQRYETEYQAWHKPAIILSISKVELENVIWLRKPLTSSALLESAGSVQALLVASDQTVADETKAVDNQNQLSSLDSLPLTNTNTLQRPEIKPQPEVIGEPLLKNEPLVTASEADVTNDSAESSSLVEEAQEEVAEEQAEQSPPSEQVQARWAQLCGEHADFDPSTAVTTMQYEESFFLSSLKDAVRLARQCQQGVLLNFPKVKIYVLPEVHRVFCPVNIDSQDFVELIDWCNVGEGGKMHILSTPEIHELNDLISQKSHALYDLEAFVWTSTLLSSQGLLPRELDPNKTVGLQHWPSMTRVESFPHVMPIAALWSSQSMSAFDVAKSLNIPQRYVFSFYNAAHALGLIEMDPEKLIKKQASPRATQAPRGLFSRLLKRLIGG